MSRRVKNIYKVSQSVNYGYDTYDSMIVVADNVEQARKMHPSNFRIWSDEKECWLFVYSDGTTPKDSTSFSSWCLPHETTVELIGVTDLYNENKVLLASFNAG